MPTPALQEPELRAAWNQGAPWPEEILFAACFALAYAVAWRKALPERWLML